MLFALNSDLRSAAAAAWRQNWGQQARTHLSLDFHGLVSCIASVPIARGFGQPHVGLVHIEFIAR